jgi:hypothetical protein
VWKHMYRHCISRILTCFVNFHSIRYIKDYDGGILMECKINPKLPYTDLATMIRRQRQVDYIFTVYKIFLNCYNPILKCIRNFTCNVIQ